MMRWSKCHFVRSKNDVIVSWNDVKVKTFIHSYLDITIDKGRNNETSSQNDDIILWNKSTEKKKSR